MIEMWEQNRPLAAALLLWTVGLLLFFLLVHLLLGGPVAELKGSEITAGQLAASYCRRSDPTTPPKAASAQSVKTELDDQWARLGATLARARQLVEFRPRQELTIPRGIAQRNVKYMDIRDNKVVAVLEQLAKKAGVLLPANLDPRRKGTGLPDEREVDELAFRLAMTDRIVRAAVAAEVEGLAEIRHELGSPRGAPLAQQTVNVKLRGQLDQIIRFLARCSPPASDPASGDSGGGILGVRAVKMSGAGGGSTLVAEIRLAALRMVDVKIRPRRRPEPAVRPARPSF